MWGRASSKKLTCKKSPAKVAKTTAGAATRAHKPTTLQAARTPANLPHQFLSMHTRKGVVRSLAAMSTAATTSAHSKAHIFTATYVPAKFSLPSNQATNGSKLLSSKHRTCSVPLAKVATANYM